MIFNLVHFAIVKEQGSQRNYFLKTFNQSVLYINKIDKG